ncbi:chromosome partitioning protein ParA [Vibrio hannami]|uniref:chromosome partitioning protein ParA n=1 Tax=Vibrio hannami TaxID=2717094 RepID=UPI0024104346|nr:chromosome partitioning protein ParA [Vibrio hannami]MDG3088169.1 chromosome partitioning protein ParA [Vibrio hannami]
MNKENDALNDEDDVVVIEERDKHTILYIALAAVLGIALGGLVGSVVTKGKWESAYQNLENQVKELEEAKSQVVVQVEKKAAQIDTEVESRLTAKLEQERKQYSQHLEESQGMVTELEKVNLDLESQIADLKGKLQASEKQVSDLNKQGEMQSIVLERSRELFQRELTVKQELDKLQREREEILPKLERYKKECDSYLEGKSWDATKKSCDQQDEANSNLSQIDQMIEVHKLDLLEIQKIADSVGI